MNNVVRLTSPDPAQEILNFLNLKAKKRFRPVPVNLKFIHARLKEGMTPEDLKAIVAMKVREALNGDYNPKYLRPATLFNCEKCEQYYGELGE